MGQVLFIVWRESIEAMLVVGILNAWLRQNPSAVRGRLFLWGGVLTGLALALMLAIGLFAASEVLADKQDLFQLGMVLVASVLIVQMVLWMRRHGRTLKRDIESGLSAQAERENWWGVLILAALAVGREGSETVVFLYGTLSAADKGSFAALALAGLAGFALALAMYGVLQLGSKLLSWRVFFRVTEVMLLLLAASLFVSGVEKMISLNWLPPLLDPVWDSSRLIDDSTPAGGVLAALTGYRAHPALTSLIAYGLFWLTIWGTMRQGRRRQA
ncbi:FTR1 family iron permease [Paludibacterium purpuratum]|uniref:High-affinity iron transporter n=1 Tax=Paludibacterium purpuratum TaxID=1144873 RepID=A0A4R7B882_9NEIS|nr:FTR1 family protein [Paludibacterium purpuratum]TDR80743.1 high-affinity iron transporter [Paludibacterium purpuratum]